MVLLPQYSGYQCFLCSHIQQDKVAFHCPPASITLKSGHVGSVAAQPYMFTSALFIFEVDLVEPAGSCVHLSFPFLSMPSQNYKNH